MKTVLITGATGNVGSQVVHELSARGASVRAFVRDAEKAARLLGNGVELARGDFADAASVRRALEGVDSLFLACANGPQQVAYETGVIAAAVAAGVRRIVKLSARGADVDAPVVFWNGHAQIEGHLRASGAPAVILQPSFYMTNLLGSAEQVRQTGSLFVPAAGARVAMIDPRDVAGVAAVVLTEDGHDGKTYVLTGPEAITFEGVAEALSSVTGQRIRFVAVPDEAAQQGMVASGMPAFVAEQIVKVFGCLRRGDQAQTIDAARSLTGREPRSFAAFARDHAGFFGSPEVGGAPTPAFSGERRA